MSRVASAQATPQGMQNRSYEDGFTVMASDPRLTGWASLLLAPYARGAKPYTVFAPTNAAKNQRPDIREMLLPSASEAFPDTSALITLVRAHVAYGLHPSRNSRARRLRFGVYRSRHSRSTAPTRRRLR